MATIPETRDRAAEYLGMLRLGQSLQPQDDLRITTSYSEVYARLKVRGLATWASDGVIPDELMPYVAMLMADNCLNTYSTSVDRYNRIKSEALTAESEIANLITGYFESQDSASDF